MATMHGFTDGVSLDEALAREAERHRAHPGLWELASLVTLVVAGTGLPVLGWLIGIVMVHLSDVWDERDRTIALVAPLAAVGALVVASAAFGPGGTPILDLGPVAVLVMLGGPTAGWLGGIYLAVRALALRGA